MFVAIFVFYRNLIFVVVEELGISGDGDGEMKPEVVSEAVVPEKFTLVTDELCLLENSGASKQFTNAAQLFLGFWIVSIIDGQFSFSGGSAGRVIIV